MSASDRIVVETTRGQIRGVVKAWTRQYGDRKPEIRERLEALDVETATAEDVAAIIGNNSWTRGSCDVCGCEQSAWVRLGDEPDYDSTTLDICGMCLAAATYALSTAGGSR